MKVFFDTSALIKKYVQESGSEDLEELLKKTEAIAVSPLYLLEIHSAILRRYRSKDLVFDVAQAILKEIHQDHQFFQVIKWTEELEDICIKLFDKHAMKTLDCIQLACGLLAKTEYFATSDKILYKYAKSEFKNAIYL